MRRAFVLCGSAEYGGDMSRAQMMNRRQTQATDRHNRKEAEPGGMELALTAEAAAGLADVLDRPEIATMWVGSAAPTLGLSGPATAEAVKALFTTNTINGVKIRRDHKGQEIITTKVVNGQKVAQRKSVNVSSGAILNFPKTLSLLMAHPDPRVRAIADRAANAGGAAFVRTLEQTVRSRTGTDGVTSVPITGLVAAEYTHGTSSTGDPHRHKHYLFSASAPCADGKWRQIDTRVLFASKRTAEAAAYAAMQDVLNAELNLSADAWVLQDIGSVRSPEIEALLPVAEQLSSARRHIAEVLEDAGRTLGDQTFLEDRTAWQQSRRDMGAMAERIEHELDAALAKGGSGADAVRRMWDDRTKGALVEALGSIKPLAQKRAAQAPSTRAVEFWTIAQTHQSEGAEIAQRISDLKKKIAIAEPRLAAVQKRYRSAKSDLNVNLNRPMRRIFAAIFGQEKVENLRRTINQAAAEYKALRKDLNACKADLKILEKGQKQSATNDRVISRYQRIEAETLAWLDTLHEWTLHDVAAYLTTEIRDPIESMRLAARMIDKWSANEVAYSQPDITSAVEAIAQKKEHDTKDIHQKTGIFGYCVTEAALKAERHLQESAAMLAHDDGVKLAVDITGLSNEQTEAAVLIAKGKKLSVVSGVAGAGKTYMLRRVADAAKKRDMRVVSIARNAQRATETGTEIGAHEQMSIAAFLGQDIKKIGKNKPILLVIDEGGVVDRDDLAQLLHLAEDGRIQIVATGDRDQAQPIDRKAGWAIMQSGAASRGQHVHLNETRRNVKWSAEAHGIRLGEFESVVAKARAESRIKPVSENHVAALASKMVVANEGAVVLTISNSEAANISRRVQELRGIRGDTLIAHDSYCAPGDRVRTRFNAHKMGVLNGDRWTVKATHRNGSVTVTSDKDTLTLPADYVRRYLELDYAVTVDSGQGLTVQKAICILRPGTGRSYLYSAATRGRDAPEYLIAGTMDEDEAASVLGDIIDTNDTARTAHEIVEEIRAAQAPPPVTQQPAAVPLRPRRMGLSLAPSPGG